MPEKYKEWEKHEQEVIKHIGKDVAMLKKTENGVTKPYTLKQLRIDYENKIKEG